MVIEVKLFGALKRCAGSEVLVVDVPEGTRVAELREQILVNLRETAASESLARILERSALAEGTKMLRDPDAIIQSKYYSFLPPVCGG